MAVSLTDLIEDVTLLVQDADEAPDTTLTVSSFSREEYRLILAALKRYEKCDGKHG